MKVSGLIPVIAALSGNIFITIIKFIGFFLSKSPSLFSEAVHSFADASNQALLLIGIRRSMRKPDEKFTYGYGQERFFWNLVSACGVFFIGAGVTIYHGVMSFSHRETAEVGTITVAILSVSLIIEIFSFLIATKELRHKHSGLKLSEMMKKGDPSTLAVLLEDGVAVIGIIVASVSIMLTHITGHYVWDATGSIIIGVMLAIVAVILINVNRGYLIEKAIPEEEREKVISVISHDPSVVCLRNFRSTTLGVDCYRVKCNIELDPNELMKEATADKPLQETYKEVKEDYGKFTRFCYEYTDRIIRLVGRRIDRLEKGIQKESPGIKYIDIEVD
jgi:solute carrier family 30 (zinc transporter), member 9